MFYPLLLVFFTLLNFIFRFSVIDFLSPWSHQLHTLCTDFAPIQSSEKSILSALTCGKNLQPEDAQLYAATGLIHLFVVSGSHLTFLISSLEFLFQKKIESIKNNWILFVIFFTFFLYTMICLLNPPILRSYIYFIISFYLNRTHKYWSRSYIILISGLITIFFSYKNLNSLGLQMSWIASLCIELNKKHFTGMPFIQALNFYFCLSVSFLCLGFPQVSSTVVSLLLTPFLEYVLFPLALISHLFPSLSFYFDKLISILNLVLNQFEFSITSPTLAIDQAFFYNWILIALLHSTLLKKEKLS